MKRTENAERLLWAALERLEASDPPKGGRTDKVCKRIRRYLSEIHAIARVLEGRET